MSESTVLEVLQQARDLIADESHWTVGALARRHGVSSEDLTSDENDQWCALGALYQVAGINTDLAADAEELLVGAGIKNFSMDIVRLNDQLGHQTVLWVYDDAIERAVGIEPTFDG